MLTQIINFLLKRFKIIKTNTAKALSVSIKAKTVSPGVPVLIFFVKETSGGHASACTN